MDIVEQARQRVAQMQQTVTPPLTAVPAPVSPKRASEDPLVNAACSQGGKTLAILTPGDWSMLLSLDKEIDEVWSVGVTSKLLAVTKRFPLEEFPYEAVAASLKTKYVVGELAHCRGPGRALGVRGDPCRWRPPRRLPRFPASSSSCPSPSRGARRSTRRSSCGTSTVPDVLMKGKVPRDVIA
jgi:hypothetical protein